MCVCVYLSVSVCLCVSVFTLEEYPSQEEMEPYEKLFSPKRVVRKSSRLREKLGDEKSSEAMSKKVKEERLAEGEETKEAKDDNGKNKTDPLMNSHLSLSLSFFLSLSLSVSLFLSLTHTNTLFIKEMRIQSRMSLKNLKKKKKVKKMRERILKKSSWTRQR